MNRRDSIRLLASTAAWPLLDGLTPDWVSFGVDVHGAALTGQSTAGPVLDAAALRLVTTACDRIIPPDETPGAAAAGVPAFIERVLADWCDPAERRRFLEGLATIDTRSRAAHAVAFVEASASQQVALLEQLDAELVDWRRSARPALALPGVTPLPAHAFGMLKFLTIWGYYTSEPGQREELGLYPRPTAYDGCAPYAPRVRRTTLVADGGGR